MNPVLYVKDNFKLCIENNYFRIRIPGKFRVSDLMLLVFVSVNL
jgi:hypothetical protein